VLCPPSRIADRVPHRDDSSTRCPGFCPVNRTRYLADGKSRRGIPRSWHQSVRKPWAEPYRTPCGRTGTCRLVSGSCNAVGCKTVKRKWLLTTTSMYYHVFWARTVRIYFSQIHFSIVLPDVAVLWLSLLLCTRKISGSNLCFDWRSSSILQSLQANTGTVPQIRPRPLPSTSSPIHYWVIMLRP
jgi:hypothetical protein